MRILLFCENKYAVDILQPIQTEADKEGNNDVLWYVHQEKDTRISVKRLREMD